MNKDYIGVVRNNRGRLQYERIPMLKSLKVQNKLVSMAEDDKITVEDMVSYVHSQIVFKFMALPFCEDHQETDMYETEDWFMKDLVDELKKAKTKVRYLECALKVLEECDYRWNAIKIDNSLPDLLFRTHRDYETGMISIRVTDDTTILFESYDLGSELDGGLLYTVYRNELPVLPYRSLVEMYDFSEDLMEVTMMFDPESAQWDNALKSLVVTANAIIENEEEFFRKNVAEAGQEMLEKMKLMCLDTESYYTWLENVSDYVSIEYSECGKSLDLLYGKDESNRRLYELYAMGRKMTCAMLLAENLKKWADQGLEFRGLDAIQTDLESIARSLLQEMEKEHDGIPVEAFIEGYGEFSTPEKEMGEIARNLRTVCEKLRLLLSMERRFPEEMNDYEPII